MSRGTDVPPGSEAPSEEIVRLLLAEKGRLLTFLEERVGSRADAEDLLQIAMLRVVTKGHALRSRDRIIPWFYRVLRNLLVDWHRRRAAAARALRRLERTVSVTQDQDEALWRQVCSCVSRILVTLRPEYTEILGRVEVDQQPVVEAARELGISANNASVRLFRARRASSSACAPRAAPVSSTAAWTASADPPEPRDLAMLVHRPWMRRCCKNDGGGVSLLGDIAVKMFYRTRRPR
jgi:RNA polymerase sigma factor (sigma-70 family)